MPLYIPAGLVPSRAAIFEEIAELEEVKGAIRNQLRKINSFLYGLSKDFKKAENGTDEKSANDDPRIKVKTPCIDAQDALGSQADKISERLVELYKLRDFSPEGRAIRAVQANNVASFKSLE